MSKVKIKLIAIGHLPADFHKDKILAWKSELFEIVGKVDQYALRLKADIEDWGFSDDALATIFPDDATEADFTIAIVNGSLQDNWYTRRLGKNRIAFTFHEVQDILMSCDLPLENVIYRVLYAYTLVFKRAGRKIPDYRDIGSFTHDETRGCLFDFNGKKIDLASSCHAPRICDECREKMINEKISSTQIDTVQREINKIRKHLYYRVTAWIKKHPIWALFISTIFAVSVGIGSSILADMIEKHYQL